MAITGHVHIRKFNRETGECTYDSSASNTVTDRGKEFLLRLVGQDPGASSTYTSQVGDSKVITYANKLTGGNGAGTLGTARVQIYTDTGGTTLHGSIANGTNESFANEQTSQNSGAFGYTYYFQDESADTYTCNYLKLLSDDWYTDHDTVARTDANVFAYFNNTDAAIPFTKATFEVVDVSWTITIGDALTGTNYLALTDSFRSMLRDSMSGQGTGASMDFKPCYLVVWSDGVGEAYTDSETSGINSQNDSRSGSTTTYTVDQSQYWTSNDNVSYPAATKLRWQFTVPDDTAEGFNWISQTVNNVAPPGNATTISLTDPNEASGGGNPYRNFDNTGVTEDELDGDTGGANGFPGSQKAADSEWRFYMNLFF